MIIIKGFLRMLKIINWKIIIFFLFTTFSLVLTFWALCPGYLYMRCNWLSPRCEYSIRDDQWNIFGPILLRGKILENIDTGVYDDRGRTIVTWEKEETLARLMFNFTLLLLFICCLIIREVQVYNQIVIIGNDDVDKLDKQSRLSRKFILAILVTLIMSYWAFCPSYPNMRCWYGSEGNDSQLMDRVRSRYGPIILKPRVLKDFNVEKDSMHFDMPEILLLWEKDEVPARSMVLFGILWLISSYLLLRKRV